MTRKTLAAMLRSLQTLQFQVQTQIDRLDTGTAVLSHEKRLGTRKLSKAGREAISKAAKKRWREYRRSRS